MFFKHYNEMKEKFENGDTTIRNISPINSTIIIGYKTKTRHHYEYTITFNIKDGRGYVRQKHQITL
jgi:hypothetical protein